MALQRSFLATIARNETPDAMFGIPFVHNQRACGRLYCGAAHSLTHGRIAHLYGTQLRELELEPAALHRSGDPEHRHVHLRLSSRVAPERFSASALPERKVACRRGSDRAMEIAPRTVSEASGKSDRQDPGDDLEQQ